MFLPNFISHVDVRIYQARELEAQRYHMEIKKKQEQSPLYEAVAQKKETAVINLLRTNASVDLDSLQKILFQFAESKEHDAILRTLLSKSPPTLIDARDSEGKTLLYKSVERGHESLTQLLISQGADSSIGDAKGLTPLDVIVYKEELTEKTRNKIIAMLVNPLQIKSNKTTILFKQNPLLVGKCEFAFDSIIKSLFFSHASTPQGRQIIGEVVKKSLSSKKIVEIVEKYRENHKKGA